ncbi:hypothetical protein [Variovorax sp. EBFNA2]|uniref:hypothetical protein n=1 Tax=Variovorax sp. EBFNA2 TaxID=3342097 RepID=UPI0029BFD4E8|nr:hypothetical protein [Variovorax boronicumulans]WPG41505.1 hypothetical protein RZE79_31840 [Variovorax boronicumulans]
MHKSSSLACTLFMQLMWLPLIFHEVIEHLSGMAQAPAMPPGTPNPVLDPVAKAVPLVVV